MQDEKTVAQILAAEGIADYPQDLLQMSAEALCQHFAFASSGRVNATRVIKNLIWQAYTAIRAGRRAPIAGHLRSFWYTDVKPVLSASGCRWKAGAPPSWSMTPLSSWSRSTAELLALARRVRAQRTQEA